MIYHYTDLTSAISIAKTTTIRLTDYRYLNDKEEFTTGLAVLREAILLDQEFTDDYDEKFIKSFKGAQNYIKIADFREPLANENLFCIIIQ